MKFNKPSINLSGLLITLIWTLSGCFTDCDFQREPSLSLSIDNGLVYTSGYALKNNIELDRVGDSSFELPIALNDARMIYAFHSSAGTDTLEVKYTKKVAYKDPCGFILSLINKESGSLTTFESVNFSEKSIRVR